MRSRLETKRGWYGFDISWHPPSGRIVTESVRGPVYRSANIFIVVLSTGCLTEHFYRSLEPQTMASLAPPDGLHTNSAQLMEPVTSISTKNGRVR